MNLVKVKESFYQLCHSNSVASELLFNECGRPCVLILKLEYRGSMRDFVVPLRTNISPTAPHTQYFSLPPHPKTKPRHHHGIHYIKIFPIDKAAYIDKYNTDKDKYYTIIHNILSANEKTIIESCQNYLKECENGNKHEMTPDIDGIINVLFPNPTD